MKFEDFVRLWALAVELWPASTAKIDRRKRLRVWELAFSDRSFDEMRDALVCLGRKQKFFPDICEIEAVLPQKREHIDGQKELERMRHMLRTMKGEK